MTVLSRNLSSSSAGGGRRAKGACLALAHVVVTTDVGRRRLWAPKDVRSPIPVPWRFAIGRDVHLRVFASNCTPNVHLAIPKILRDIGLFLELLLIIKSQEAVRTRIWQDRLWESNKTNEGPSRAREILEWTGWRGFRVSIIARCRDGLKIASTPAAAAACEPYLPLSILLK